MSVCHKTEQEEVRPTWTALPDVATGMGATGQTPGAKRSKEHVLPRALGGRRDLWAPEPGESRGPLFCATHRIGPALLRQRREVNTLLPSSVAGKEEPPESSRPQSRVFEKGFLS